MLNSNLVSNRGSHFLFVVCLLVFSTIGKTYAVDENPPKQSEAITVQRRASHPYCGLYCLYVVAKLTGREVGFQELVKPEYISSRRGSSLAEIKKAAEDNGLYAAPAGNLTSRVLYNCPYPVILHVKSDVMSPTYDHYELFLGTENGKAKLFNPPEPVGLVPFRELVPRWDGNGLVVSGGPIDLSTIFTPVRRRFVLYVAIATAVILMIHWTRRWLPETILNSRRKLLGLSIAQGAGFAVAALLCGMIYHFINDEGFLANATATASIQQAHLGNFIPKISEKKIHKFLNTDTVFIDARLERDFKTGHLEGAINVPVDANDIQRQKIMADIAKDANIVVYCQSAGCKFAEKVAINLMENGYSNVSIFRGGWSKWIAKNDKLKEKPS